VCSNDGHQRLCCLGELTKGLGDENLDGFLRDQSGPLVYMKFLYQTALLQVTLSDAILMGLSVMVYIFEDVPIKAMSYLTSSDARHGKYGRRPKVEIPENTESALENQLASSSDEQLQLTYLSSAISGQRVIPESFVRTRNWYLTFMVTVRKCTTGSQNRGSRNFSKHCEERSN
jgi:hypothetical protein